MRNTELNLKGATVDNGLKPHGARFPELALKLERLHYSPWFYPEHRREYQSKLCTDHSWAHLSEMTRERALLHCMLSEQLRIFTKIKLLIINIDRSVVVFCRCFTS